MVTARWVDNAPLASPVEPDVNRIVASSSGRDLGQLDAGVVAVEQRRERSLERLVDVERHDCPVAAGTPRCAWRAARRR